MTTYVPPSATADAKNRAFRTLMQALLVDILAALGVILAYAAGTLEWTREYWVGLGLLAAKSVVTAIVAFFARKLAPPAV